MLRTGRRHPGRPPSGPIAPATPGAQTGIPVRSQVDAASGTVLSGRTGATRIAPTTGPSGTLPGPSGTLPGVEPAVRPIPAMPERAAGRDPLVDAMTGPIAGAPVAVAEHPPAVEPDTGPDAPVVDMDAVHRDPRFRKLRARQRRFVLTVTPLFLSWYGLFVVLSAFAPSLMRTPVIGSINAGLLLGLAQFVSTLAIVAVYGRFARRRLDPGVRELRDDHIPRPEPRPLLATPDEIWSS